MTVKDINYRTPDFSSPSVIYLSEDTPVKTLVYIATASLEDPSVTSSMTYAIQSGASEVFTLGSADGVLTLTRVLNHRQVALYTLLLSATSSQSGLSSAMNLSINILPANRNAPQFTQAYQSVRVSEQTPCGSDVISVTANDSDEGAYGEVYYAIAAGDVTETFYVNPTSGHVFLQRALHWEIQSMYNLTVTAYDHGTPPLTSNTSVTIIVDDVNDCSPIFPDVPYFGYVLENQAGSNLPTTILAMTAVDFDSGRNSQLTYLIIDGDTNTFSINRTTGLISAISTLNREVIPQYILTIMAIDSGEIFTLMIN